MSLLAGLACIVVLLGVGWWPMRAWAPELAGPGRIGRSAVALALGAAITGLVQVALSAVGVPARAVVPAVLAGVSLIAGRMLVARGEAGTSAAEAAGACPRPPAWLKALLLAVALVSAGASAGLPFRSDGSKFWAPRARELAETGASAAPSLHDPARLAVHRDYPLLVPALLAPVFAHSPPDASSGPKLVLAALNLALLGVLAGQLLRGGTRARMLLIVVVTLPFVVALDVRESAVSGGYADSTDALFLLLLVICAEKLRVAGGTRSVPRLAALAGLLGAALVSTKLEGAVELAIVAAAWLATGPVRAPLGRCLAWTAVLCVPTGVIRAGIAASESGLVPARLVESGFVPARLLEGSVLVARGLPVLAGLGRLLVDVSCFGLLLPLLLLWLLPGAAAPVRGTRTFALWLLLGAAAFLFASYITTNMEASRHIHTSAHRVAWHWLPALAWLVARVRASDAAPDGAEAVAGTGTVAA